MRIQIRALAVAALAALALFVPGLMLGEAAAQPGDAEARDAAAYASRFGVSHAEAVRRLSFQTQAAELDLLLGTAEVETFAGLWIEHEPKYRVVAAFTRHADGTLQRYLVGSALRGIVEPAGAAYPLKRLRADLRGLRALSREVNVELRVVVQQNRVEVLTTSPESVRATAARVGVAIPETATIVAIPAHARAVADIYGGLALDGNGCTSGFGVVQGSTGSRGITTAGHCGDTASYQGTNLPYQEGWWQGSQDGQWHLAPGFQVRNWVSDGGGSTREITSRTYRASQSVGSWVCKYGRVTGYGCTRIYSTDYQPPDTCVPFATATFIQTTDDIVEPGDSGGPVYWGNSAYGNINCQASGSFFVYVAIDYTEQSLGVSILTGP